LKESVLEWLFRVSVCLIFVGLWGIDFGALRLEPIVVDFRPIFYAEFTSAAWLNWNYALIAACCLICLAVFELYEKLTGRA